MMLLEAIIATTTKAAFNNVIEYTCIQISVVNTILFLSSTSLFHCNGSWFIHVPKQQ